MVKSWYTNTDLTQRPYRTRIGGYAEDRARPKLLQKPAFRRPQIPTLELHEVYLYTPKRDKSYLIYFQLFTKERLITDVFSDPECRRRCHFLRVMIRKEPRQCGRNSCGP